jgi:15-cis-phytoene synthase
MAETCQDIVRSGDKDTFLSILFAPAETQPHLFALHAFVVEVARIPQLVSEPQIGEIRLQWWADTLTSISQGIAQDHPVAKALAETIAAHTLPIAPLAAHVEARRFDLYADKLPSLNDLEGHCGEIRSALFQLACTILDPVAAPQAAEASGLAGVAFEISRCMLSPAAGKWVPEGSSVADVLELAERRRAEAALAIAKLPASLRPVFLPQALVPLYLNYARAGKFSVPQWRRQWRLWRAAA